MIHTKRKYGHRGYRPPGWFSRGGPQLRFSNLRLLGVVTLVAAGICLLTWWLSYSSGGG